MFFFCLVFSVSIITDATVQPKDATESFGGRNCLQVLVHNMRRIVLSALKIKKKKIPETSVLWEKIKIVVRNPHYKSYARMNY